MPFKPGQSGNPGGRPKGLAAEARRLGDRALKVVEEALFDEDRKVQLAAANIVFDRGWGKPVQMTADLTNKLDDLSDAELDSAIDVLRQSLGSDPDAGARADKATKH